MLAKAGVRFPLGEEDVSAIVMNLGLLQHETLGLRELLRGRER